MEKVFLTIAGCYIELNLYPSDWGFIKDQFITNTLNVYKGFFTSRKPKAIDYKIDIVQKRVFDVLYKKELKSYFTSFYERISRGRLRSYYQISLSQFQIILKDILQEILPKKRGLIVHASAVDVAGKPYVFMGKATSGKSTAMALLSSRYPALADDTAIIRKEGRNFYFYQSPFLEKNSWIKKKNQRYKIGKLFFLRKTNMFKIERIIDKEYILSRFIKQLWTKELYLKNQIKYILEFVNKNNFYFLYFGKNKDRLIKLIKKHNEVPTQ